MTHRDELLALQARVEAQERAIDEAKSENELLRAAHAKKTREAETMRRELEELRAGFDDGGLDFDVDGDPPPRDVEDHHGLARSLHLAAAMVVGIALVGTMMLALAASRHAHHARVAYAAPPPAAAVTPLVREGTVIATSGPEVVAVGEQCTVERIPAYGGGFDCRVEVRCGDQFLYGEDPNAGYVRCGGREVVRDRHVTARDGDPAMTLDLGRNVVTLEERVGLGTQRVQIELGSIPDY